MGYKKQKSVGTNNVRGDLINKSKRGEPEDIKQLLEVYLDDNKKYSGLAKEPLNKTRVDLLPYIEELMPLYKKRDLKRWHKLIVLGLRKRPDVFLEDLIEEREISGDSISFRKNIRNIDWDNKRTCQVAVELLGKVIPYPTEILNSVNGSKYKSLFKEAITEQILTGNCQHNFLSFLSKEPDVLRIPGIQNQVMRVFDNEEETECEKFKCYIDLNTKKGTEYINKYSDLAKIHKLLIKNILGIEEEKLSEFTEPVVIVWKLINHIDLNEDNQFMLNEYLNSLRNREYLDQNGDKTGCPQYVVNFLMCLEDEDCLDIMTSIYDNPISRTKYLEDKMLSMHSERVYRDWISIILTTSDLSVMHITAKKLLRYYPENIEEILYVVDAVGIENYYTNVIKMCEELSLDLSHVHRKDIEAIIQNDNNIGLAIYSSCISNNDSIEELLYSLEKQKVYLSDLKKSSFNRKNLAQIGQALQCSSDFLAKTNEEIAQTFIAWMKYIPKNNWGITGEINEDAHAITIQVQVPRNADETLVLVKKADLSDVTLSAKEIRCYLLYKDIAFTDTMQVNTVQLRESIDGYCFQNKRYQYLIEDINRISYRGLKRYVIDMTDTKTILWQQEGLIYRAMLGEEVFIYNPSYKSATGLLQVQIENRMTYFCVDIGNETELKRMITGITPVESEKKQEISIIGVADFLVRTTNYSCTNRDHKLIRIKALVSVMTHQSIKEMEIDAAFCPECNKYYILEREYLRLKAHGKLCCKVVEFDELIRSGLTFNSWAEKSVLRIYGYNVNKNENLSKGERQRILSFVMENHIMTSYEIINHLEWQISTREGRTNMRDAISKWEDDIRFVRDFQYIDKTVRVRSIFIKNKIKR